MTGQSVAAFDFLVETFETERLKTPSVWSQFRAADLESRPAPPARSVREQVVHQCLSEDAWFSKMLGITVGDPALPEEESRIALLERYAATSDQRLVQLRGRPSSWFEGRTQFFAAERSRAWVLMRRIAHTAHHRGQLTTYHRLLGHALYSTYGPTADTGGLPANGGEVVYRYSSVAALLAGERAGGKNPPFRGSGPGSPTERPIASSARRSGGVPRSSHDHGDSGGATMTRDADALTGSDAHPRVDAPRSNRLLLAVAGILLTIPVVALLWVGSYARVEPQVAGFPFFIWYQFVWVFLCSALTWAAYRVIRIARGGVPRRAPRDGEAGR